MNYFLIEQSPIEKQLQPMEISLVQIIKKKKKHDHEKELTFFLF